MAGKATRFELGVLREMASRAFVYPDGIGPAALSGLIWPDSHAGRGAAPGTGLVRPMLAALARLKKKGLVVWTSHEGAPVIWCLTPSGVAESKRWKRGDDNGRE